MTKLIGFILVQVSALLHACRSAALERRNMQQAEDFCTMLEQLYGLLEREASAMPELLTALNGRTDRSAASFIQNLERSLNMLGARSFQELWHDALYASAADNDKELLAILDKPGAVLGRYELRTQLDMLCVCLDELRHYCEKRRQKLPQTMRLTLGLLLSSGLLLGILLL